MGNGSAEQKVQTDGSASEWSHTRVQIVAVGDRDGWLTSQGALPATPNVVYAAIEDISAEMLEALAPELVVSPVVSHSFDCIDLAQILSDLNYEGAYRAVGMDLPRPQMIENEIKQLCPRLDFQILRDG